MALMEPQHHPEPSRAPWGSHLGFFTFQQFLPDVTLCPGHGAGSVPVPLQQLSGYLEIVLSVLLSLMFQTHSLAVGSLFPVS